MFKIIVPAYNSPLWIGKCLSSIEEQTNKNFEVCVVDDLSSIDEQRDIIKQYCDRNNWKYIFNTERKYALYNIDYGIRSMNCDDNDVIITVDGDDFLNGPNVLSVVDGYYSENIYLTYGQYVASDNNHNSRYFTFRPSDEVIKRKQYRRIPWLCTHLKTFKYKLFKNIRKQHFLDRDGSYFKTASDLAIMFPMIEMAGEKFTCINDLLYVYNTDNALSDFRIARNDQARADGVIRSYPVYPTMV